MKGNVTPSRMLALNLGCGYRLHPDWVNVDFTQAGPGVLAHDLRRGIPFEDGMFDVVYHSHLLEHLPKSEALALLQECFRVLKPGGVIRVVVPDLERIARIYLQALEKARAGEAGWRANYEWMMLELYDQTVRESPGGAMLEYLKQNPVPNLAFVYERFGAEARNVVESLADPPSQGNNRRPAFRHWFAYILRNLVPIAKRKLLRLLLSAEDRRALEVGRFRERGEVHRWMYDRFSLARLLEDAGFREPQQRGPTDSQIPGWASQHLDTEPDGTVYKPDSLFMEAVKP